MAFFGVELNAQINKLVYNIKLTLAKNKYNPNFRTIYRSFIKYDPEQTGYVNSTHFEKVLIHFRVQALGENGIFFKKFEYQVFEKAFGDQGNIHWFSLMSLLREPMNPARSAAA